MRSVSFLLSAIFLWLVREKHRPQKVIQVAFCCRSEHHTVLIKMSISGLSAVLPRTEDRSDANLGKCAVSFAVCLVCGFPTFNLRCTAENNAQEYAKLIEGMNGLF